MPEGWTVWRFRLSAYRWLVRRGQSRHVARAWTRHARPLKWKSEDDVPYGDRIVPAVMHEAVAQIMRDDARQNEPAGTIDPPAGG